MFIIKDIVVLHSKETDQIIEYMLGVVCMLGSKMFNNQLYCLTVSYISV